MFRGALAFFVKTPGLSPIKTRLASEMGKDVAAEFYQRALRVLRGWAVEIPKCCPNIEIFWAIAEANAKQNSLWSDLPCVWQGAGGLGARLFTVYQQLLQDHDFVVLMGADSPQISLGQICAALKLSAQFSADGFVLGPSHDGGFYYFSGGCPLSREVWEQVEYSSESTLSELSLALQPYGQMIYLGRDFDVDTRADFAKLAQSTGTEEPSDFAVEQRELQLWAKEILG